MNNNGRISNSGRSSGSGATRTLAHGIPLVLIAVLAAMVVPRLCLAQDTAQPADAYFLPVSQKGQLQTALDTHKRVRLQENGDYRGLSSITLRSGQGLFGMPGVKVPDIVVEPGTEGAQVNMVKGTRVTFPPSTIPTRHNRFHRIGDVVVDRGTVEENEFVDLGKISVDTRTQGRLRFNRFIRVWVHSAWPQVRMLGDAGRNSFGNVFVWNNFLTAHGDTLIVENQGDLTFFGIDMETWNWENDATKPAALWSGRGGPIRILGGNGGNLRQATWNGIFDMDVDELQVYDEYISPARDPHTIFRASNQRSLFVNCTTHTEVDQASNPFRFDAFRTDSSYHVNKGAAGATLTQSQQDTLRSMVIPNRPGTPVPWDRPSFVTPPDPAGPNWRNGLGSRPDSSAQIQALVNAHGIARLAAGFYYLDNPVILHAGQGIVGAGKDQTVIIAKRPDLDMIRFEGAGSIPFNLVDLTLKGGRNGLLHPTAGQQVVGSIVSHVMFREMSSAGICFDKIYAYDNNMLDHVYFVNCASGFKQITDPNYPGGDTPTVSYMDKTVFFQCQFIGCGRGIDIIAKRGNNLNAWIECLFKDNTEAAVAMHHNLTPIFANCEFVNNAGNPVVYNDDRILFANCRFRAGTAGAGSMLSGNSTAEACVFERYGSTTATILTSPGRNFFYNCTSADMPMGAMNNGLLFNNQFALNSALSQQGVLVSGGAPTTFLPGNSVPRGQFLAGREFPWRHRH